jgi:hypothetical protein
LEKRLDQIKQGLLGHHQIHIGQEILQLGALFGGELLVLGITKLLTTFT